MRRRTYYAWRYVRRGLQLTWRNRFITVAACGVITPLMFVVYLTIAMSGHADQAAHKVDDQLKITATIQQDDDNRSVVPAEQVAQRVRVLPNVKSVRVITRQEARARFLRQVDLPKGAEPAVWVFQEALEISVHDTQAMQSVRDAVARQPGVQDATYLAELVKKLTAFSAWLQTGALAFAVLLSFVAVLVISFMVRTSIHLERDSVRIMSQVGGSTLTIAAPLLVHMLIVVALSAALACLGGYFVDPMLGSSKISQLPDWLRTSRAFGLMELWPLLFGAGGAAVSAIVAYGTVRYARA